MLFMGPMRCGKSNTIAYLLESVDTWVLFDSKRHPDEWLKWAPTQGAVVSQDPADILRHPRVVHQVSMLSLQDVSGWRNPGSAGYAWTEALTNVLRRGETVAIFDETVHTLPAGRPHQVAIQIYTQGAAWGVSPWAVSQFANRIETATVRAAVHCFCWRMNPYDLRMVGEKRGVPVEDLSQLPACVDPNCPTYPRPHSHGFGYHLTTSPTWQLCGPVERVM